MAEIPCRRCDSPDCKGCNIYTLATALQQGKFEPLMDGNGTVHIAASVRENVTGKWIWDDEGYHCSECLYHAYGNTGEVLTGQFIYCPWCGAKLCEEED